MLGRLIIQARPRHLALALLIYAPVAVVMFGRWPGSLAAISRACDGLRPFDVRKSWGADDARALVDACGADGRSAYLHQQLLDLVYPTVLAAALLVTIALLVRRYGTRAWPTLLPVLLMTALDYAENAGIWTLLARWPHVDATVANLAGTATTAKLVIGTVAFCTPLVAGTVELAQRLRHRRAKAPGTTRTPPWTTATSPTTGRSSDTAGVLATGPADRTATRARSTGSPWRNPGRSSPSNRTRRMSGRWPSPSGSASRECSPTPTRRGHCPRERPDPP